MVAAMVLAAAKQSVRWAEEIWETPDGAGQSPGRKGGARCGRSRFGWSRYKILGSCLNREKEHKKSTQEEETIITLGDGGGMLFAAPPAPATTAFPSCSGTAAAPRSSSSPPADRSTQSGAGHASSPGKLHFGTLTGREREPIGKSGGCGRRSRKPGLGCEGCLGWQVNERWWGGGKESRIDGSCCRSRLTLACFRGEFHKGRNPLHTILGVRLIEHIETYF